jgi:hypothetical protein
MPESDLQLGCQRRIGVDVLVRYHDARGGQEKEIAGNKCKRQWKDRRIVWVWRYPTDIGLFSFGLGIFAYPAPCEDAQALGVKNERVFAKKETRVVFLGLRHLLVESVQHGESVRLALVAWFLPFAALRDSVTNERNKSGLRSPRFIDGEWGFHDLLEEMRGSLSVVCQSVCHGEVAVAVDRDIPDMVQVGAYQKLCLSWAYGPGTTEVVVPARR